MALEQFIVLKEKAGLAPAKLREFFNPYLLIGIILVSLGTVINIFPKDPSPKHPSKIASPVNIGRQAKPQRVAIPTLGINIPISEGGVVNGEWILSETTVLFLPTSGSLGEGYNTILYAHKRSGLFLNLKNIKRGAEIFIQDTNGQNFTYRVYFIERVKASEVSKLKSGIKDTLTLFTCDGLFDELRLIVKAKLAADIISPSPEDISGTNRPGSVWNHQLFFPASTLKPSPLF